MFKHSRTMNCNIFIEILIATNGVWGSWTPYSSCSKSCGKGYKSRVRECNKPPPLGGGKPCVGHAKETVNCNKDSCSCKKNQISIRYLFGQQI